MYNQKYIQFLSGIISESDFYEEDAMNPVPTPPAGIPTPADGGAPAPAGGGVPAPAGGGVPAPAGGGVPSPDEEVQKETAEFTKSIQNALNKMLMVLDKHKMNKNHAMNLISQIAAPIIEKYNISKTQAFNAVSQ
jgi:hypothetical protein